MSEEAIENELNCVICCDTYSNPKILQCFHIFCRKCLVKLVRDQQGQLSLSCPICRQVTPVPANGTAGLKSAYHINRLLEVLEQHKKVKGEAGNANREDCDSNESSTPRDYPAICCSEHDGREVDLYCESCEELICFECAIKGGTHHSHDYQSISESFERYKQKVTPSLQPIEENMSAIAKVLSQLEMNYDEVTQQQGNIETAIRDSCRRLHEIIEKRQNELIDQLDQITRRKLKSLATQKDQIETLQAQLSSYLNFTTKSLKEGIKQREVLFMKAGVLKQAKELLAIASKSDAFNICAEADVVFLASADAAAKCEKHGWIYVPNAPDPLKCIATGKGTEEAVVGEKAAATLSAVNFIGKPCSVTAMSFGVELVSVITGGKVLGSVERHTEKKDQGKYDLSYHPIVKGKHQLLIKADGQHIKGSPFSLAVKSPVEKLGTPIQILCHLGEPGGIAVTEKGEVVLTNWDMHCVSVFSPSGEKLRSFGKEGSENGEFVNPNGVAVDGEGNIIVVDRGNHRIQKFTANGHFIKSVSSGKMQFNFPYGIAYCPANRNIYMTDKTNHCVQVLNSDLKFIGMFGKEGSEKGQFNYPYGVTTDSTGRVYVADSGNHRIQVFTAEGSFLRLFGREGAGNGELDLPYGVAVDMTGMVYVSEYWNHRVSVFTSEGSFVTSFGCKGAGPGHFDGPRELAVDDSGVVYVCDSENHRLQIF